MRKILALCALAALLIVPLHPEGADTSGSPAAVPETGLAPEDIPNPVESGTGWVTSIGGFLSGGDIARINELVTGIERDTSVEIAVVVVPALRDDIFTTCQDLFDRWGIGKADNDNGLLVLADIGGRDFRTHTGYGMEGILTDALISYLQESIVIPEFKNASYGPGIIKYLGKIDEILREPEALAAVKADVDRSARARNFRENALGALIFGIAGFLILVGGFAFLARSARAAGAAAKKEYGTYERIVRLERSGFAKVDFALPLFMIPFGGVFLLVGLGISGVLGIGRVFLVGGTAPLAGTALTALAIAWAASKKRAIIRRWRAGPRACPECGSSMRKCPETEDDRYLKPFQIAEERVKSEDYDVWLCPECRATTVERYRAGRYFLYTECPSCGGLTARQTRRVVVVRPTYERSGEASLVFSCLSCGAEFSKVAIIPRLTRSSSGSGSSSGGSGGGSSFGGGSSGGGGSTSSW